MKLQGIVKLVLLTLMFIGAFAAGQWYSTTVSAQSRGAKWDYQVIKADRIEGSGATLEIKGLSKMAEDGWEVAGINDSWVLLKRGR